MKRQPLPGFQFVFAGSFYVLVEARDQDLALGVLQFADDFDQAKEGIGRSAAVHTGMQVGLRSHRLNFGVDQAAQPHAQSGEIGGKKFGIADQGEISLQLGLFLAHIRGDGLAANFFFPFDDELHVQRQLAAVTLHQGLDGFDFHPELALVVDRAASVDVIVALGRAQTAEKSIR